MNIIDPFEEVADIQLPWYFRTALWIVNHLIIYTGFIVSSGILIGWYLNKYIAG